MRSTSLMQWGTKISELVINEFTIGLEKLTVSAVASCSEVQSETAQV